MNLQSIFHKEACIILHRLVIFHLFLLVFNLFLISFHLSSPFENLGLIFLVSSNANYSHVNWIQYIYIHYDSLCGLNYHLIWGCPSFIMGHLYGLFNFHINWKNLQSSHLVSYGQGALQCNVGNLDYLGKYSSTPSPTEDSISMMGFVMWCATCWVGGLSPSLPHPWVFSWGVLISFPISFIWDTWASILVFSVSKVATTVFVFDPELSSSLFLRKAIVFFV